jgi:uncharacterized membrane protein
MIFEILRTIAGLILTLFIPGYALSLAFFPQKQDMDRSERIALSFALSIAGVMVTILFTDLVLGIDITPVSIVLSIITLTLISLIAWKVHLYIINKKIIQKILGLIFKSIEKLRAIKLRKHV